jgi:3-deoxy-manno-octulosonate cytidylyltransferase (CMP-KDO synthetase)
MKTVAIIPARYKSTRFPGKPLTPLLGKPMILWVADLAAKALGKENIFVATEDKRIVDSVESSGYKAVMTSERALTGTDRLAEAAEKIDADIYINVQGDEPVLNPDDILKIRDKKIEMMDCVINGFCFISEREDPESVNIPKVIATEQNKLIYMSRLALPGFKDPKKAPAKYKKQVCIYAFTKKELIDFKNFGRKSHLEDCEDIEILRFLEMGKSVIMVETSGGSLAVDIEDDIAPVVEALKRIHGL